MKAPPDVQSYSYAIRKRREVKGVIMSDIDPIETQEWKDAIASVVEFEGKERAEFLLKELMDAARQANVSVPAGINTPYINTIATEDEAQLPGDMELESQIRRLERWNAMAMVLRAGKFAPELGGHIASYASSAALYSVGFNHFFHARTKDHLGDLVYIQGHASPGIYARAYLEGRLSDEQLENFRQEVDGKGISSYPHPWLMPDFWQFPTVSMGLGPLQAIYQARFMKYMENRGFIKNKNRKVWAFLGDGETDEPESLGALLIASRDSLDNLIFVVNCNLQRLDGPVRGNGKIVQELEGMFRGAGWNVLKVLWGGRWDKLLAKDKSGLLVQRMNECCDGEYQAFRSKDGAYIREHFFGKYPELLELVSDMSDDDIWHLNRGGHDPQKVYAAYHRAVNHTGQPTVILAQTIKGFGMGHAGESANIAHQQKKMTDEDVQQYVERFKMPVPKSKIKNIEFHRPAKTSPEMKYLHERRKALGGYLPERHHDAPKLPVPSLDLFSSVTQGSGDREMSTTMVFVRILAALLKDKKINKNLVPILADEGRTFGMEGMFRQIGIYSPVGQLYEPEDKSQIMYYREAKDGQLLEEGISEAGAFSSWLSAATSYSNNGIPMIPFYIFYSMFGFQRIGDLAWAASDLSARGFLIGSLAGRTTLAGEGLQHTDGHNLIFSSVNPSCISYDPTYGYEYAVIIQDGLRRMYQEQENVFYYLTAENENYTHPAMPKGVEKGIIKGMYLLDKASAKTKTRVQLLSSGAILREAREAAAILEKEFSVAADVWSVTSFTELRREAMDVERENRLNPTKKEKTSYLADCLHATDAPVIASTDYMKLHSDQIRPFISNNYYVLGTDGFGRSDTRKKLREFFEVDRYMIAYTALYALAKQGKFDKAKLVAAQKKLNINPKKTNPHHG